MRREEDIVNVPMEIVTITAKNAMWYYLYAKAAVAFTYFMSNC